MISAKGKPLTGEQAKRREKYLANAEKHRAKAREWLANNKERHREAVKRYRAANPDVKRAEKSKRRAMIRGAGGSFTAKDVQSLLVSQRWLCVYCKVSIQGSHEIDHVIPLALGGRNDKGNLQLLCGPCNRKKGAMHPVEFAQQQGFLL